MTNQVDELPEWTDEERLLLASAELDRPPGSALPRTLRAATSAALAAGTLATPAAALTLGGKTSALFGLVKQLGVVKWLAVFALAGGAAVGVKSWRDERAARTPVQAPAATVAQKNGLPQAPIAMPAAEAAAVASVTLPEPSQAALAPRTSRPASVRAEASVPSQPDLSRDIAALDAARRALRSGQPAEALAALDRYDAEFGKNAALRVEARVLRIEALARSGESARAQAMAKAFIKQNPKSPYVERLRALVTP